MKKSGGGGRKKKIKKTDDESGKPSGDTPRTGQGKNICERRGKKKRVIIAASQKLLLFLFLSESLVITDSKQQSIYRNFRKKCTLGPKSTVQSSDNQYELILYTIPD